MNNNIGNDSAFPLVVSQASSEAYMGLTKREWLAGMALEGMLAGSRGLSISKEQFASQAAALADALIAELSKPHASLDH
jgi:hypothetical protein